MVFTRSLESGDFVKDLVILTKSRESGDFLKNLVILLKSRESGDFVKNLKILTRSRESGVFVKSPHQEVAEVVFILLNAGVDANFSGIQKHALFVIVAGFIFFSEFL